MPRIKIITGHGVPYYCDSSNPETLAVWLLEILEAHVTIQSDMPPMQIRIEPLFMGYGDPAADWHPNLSQAFNGYLGGNEPADNIRGLISALSHYAELVSAGSREAGEPQ